MTSQKQDQLGLGTLCASLAMSQGARTVLYADDPREGLLRCGRAARLQGDRVVSAALKGEDRRKGRQALYALIERMIEGEFNTIVAQLSADTPVLRGARLIRLSCVTAEQ